MTVVISSAIPEVPDPISGSKNACSGPAMKYFVKIMHWNCGLQETKATGEQICLGNAPSLTRNFILQKKNVLS